MSFALTQTVELSIPQRSDSTPLAALEAALRSAAPRQPALLSAGLAAIALPALAGLAPAMGRGPGWVGFAVAAGIVAAAGLLAWDHDQRTERVARWGQTLRESGALKALVRATIFASEAEARHIGAEVAACIERNLAHLPQSVQATQRWVAAEVESGCPHLAAAIYAHSERAEVDCDG